MTHGVTAVGEELTELRPKLRSRVEKVADLRPELVGAVEPLLDVPASPESSTPASSAGSPS
jgi:hypothetical protein